MPISEELEKEACDEANLTRKEGRGSVIIMGYLFFWGGAGDAVPRANEARKTECDGGRADLREVLCVSGVCGNWAICKKGGRHLSTRSTNTVKTDCTKVGVCVSVRVCMSESERMMYIKFF